MPTFYASGISVKLSTADLSSAVTEAPQLKNSPQVHANVSKAHAAFDRGTVDGTLHEDGLFDGNGDNRLRFLGCGRDMPFFLVHAGERPSAKADVLANSNQSVGTANGGAETSLLPMTRKRRLEQGGTDGSPSSQGPRALCLSVNLSERTYFAGSKGLFNQPLCSDLKINIYFNGQLTDSVLLNTRVPRTYACRFSGHRIHQLVERPWIFHHDSDILTQVRRKARAFRSGKDRWDAVSQNLLDEIERQESDLDGSKTKSGEYMRDLARMAVPSVVENLDITSGRRIGIMDVIIAYGLGSKLGPDTPYLYAPTPLKVLALNQATPSYHRFSAQDSEGPTRRPAAAAGQHERSDGLAQRYPTQHETSDKPAEELRSVKNLTAFLLGKLAAQGKDVSAEPSTQLLDPADIAAALHETQDVQEDPVQRRPAPTYESPDQRRTRLPHDHGVQQPPAPLATAPTASNTDSRDVKTLLELSRPMSTWLDAVSAVSQQPQRSEFSTDSPAPNDSTVTCTTATTNASSPLSTPPPLSPHPVPATRTSRWVSLKLPVRHQNTVNREQSETSHPLTGVKGASRPLRSQSVQPKQTEDSDAEARLLNECALNENPGPGPSLHETATTSARSLSVSSSSKRRPSKRRRSERDSEQSRRRSTWNLPLTERLDGQFEPGDLDEACKIGYADPGIWRQVASKRGGWFKEEGVLMGTRFVLW